jgi:hypothetical protein
LKTSLIVVRDDPKPDFIDFSPRPLVTLIFNSSNGWQVAAGLESLANLSFSQNTTEYTVIIGKNGMKEELKEYDPSLYD